MIRQPPRSTLDRSSAASDVYKRQPQGQSAPNPEAETKTEDPKGDVQDASYEVVDDDKK